MPRPGISPPAPFIAPSSGSIDQRLAQIGQAISKKADLVTVPTYEAIHLIAPDGSTWMVSVDATGALQTAQMPR